VSDILSKGGDKSGVKAALGGSVAEVASKKEAPATKASPAKKLAGAKVVPADMTSSATAPAKLKTKKGGDDLTKLAGVGPALLKKLNAADIMTFQQIAAWTSDDVVLIDEKLSLKGRIGREGWIEQAKEFANKV
jgi:large subunit ribosomal protein L21